MSEIKALEWQDAKDKGYAQANCVLGQYQVSWLGEFECWQCCRPHKAGNSWADNFSRHPSKDEAKAAAVADYEARIRSALVSTPPAAPVTGEESATEQQLRELFGMDPEDGPLEDVIATHDGEWRKAGRVWHWHAGEELAVPYRVEIVRPLSASPSPVDSRDGIDVRVLAVEIVDGLRGYTCEFSSHPAAHIADYDAVEERIRAALASAKAHVEGVTVTEAEAKALLYGVPRHEFSSALTRLASWLAAKEQPPSPKPAAVSEGGEDE